MMISTKGRYALRVMIELSADYGNGYVALKDIARRQCISEKYLEAIMKKLVQDGLVAGMRGKGGGYQLAKAPEDCAVGEILRATEQSLAPVACLERDTNDCPRKGKCATLPMWKELNELIEGYFDGISLAQLTAQAREIEGKIGAEMDLI